MGQFSNNPKVQATVLAFIAVLMFSTKSVFAKMALDINNSPISVLFMRTVIGLPVFMVICWIIWRKNKSQHAKHYKDYIMVFALAMIGYYFSSILDFNGLQYIGASVERIVLFLYPTFVLILSAIFLKQRIKKQQIIAIVICYIGLFIAFADKLEFGGTDGFWKGIIFVAGASFTYAIFLTASNKYIPKIGSQMFTTISIASFSICIIVHFLITGDYSSVIQNEQYYIACGLMALIGTIIPAYMFNSSIKHLGASNVSIISSLGPVETMVMSAFALNEFIADIQIIGTIVVIIGVIVLKLKFKGTKFPVRLYLKGAVK